MLEFSDISLSIAGKPLLSDCSGQIQAGDWVMLTGSSGSGKSLLLQVLAGLLPYDQPNLKANPHANHAAILIPIPRNKVSRQTSADSIDNTVSEFNAETLFCRFGMTWQGKPIDQYSPQQWHANIGYVQQTAVMLAGSVLDNLQLPFTFKHYQQQSFDLQWQQQQLMALGKSSEFLQQDSQLLSGGERQLVNLLRTLQLSPPLLLLDEPTSALDPDSCQQFEQLLRYWQQADASRSVLWVSHDMTQVDRLLTQAQQSGLAAKHWQMQAGRLSY